MRSCLLLSVSLLVLACGAVEPSPPETGPVSGTRLRVRYEVSGEDRVFAGFHDTERGETCWFAGDATATASRCLPPRVGVSEFADPACTTPAVRFPAGWCGELPRYAAEPAADDCADVAEPSAMWELDLTSELSTVYVREGDACTAVPVPEGDRAHAAAAEIPLSAFVAATVELADGASRLRERRLVAEDGAHQPMGAHDTELDEVCDPFASGGACMPAAAASNAAYSDAACSSPAVLWQPWGCDPATPTYVKVRADACAAATLHRAGASLGDSTIYYDGGGQCTPQPPQDGVAFAVGDEVSTVAYARVVADIAGRLRPYLDVADGVELPVGMHRDTELGIDCHVRQVDDARRCLPSGHGVLGLPTFTDAACTEPARVTTAFADACTDTWEDVRYATATPLGGCPSDVEVYEVGDELTPGSLYLRNGEACDAWTWDREEQRLYAVGDVVPAETFAAFELVTE